MAIKGSLDYFLQEIPQDVLDSQDKFGETAINYAAMNGHTALVQRLLDLGANPDIQSYYIKNYALTYAIEGHHTEIVEALINAGTNVNLQRNAPWKTALIMARHLKSNQKIIDLIDLASKE